MPIYAEEALTQLFLDSARVGALARKRILPDWVTQGVERPYATVINNNRRHVHHMTAASGVVIARVQVDAWADDKPAAMALYDALRLAADGFRGIVTVKDNDGATVGTLKVSMCHLDTDAAVPSPPQSGSDKTVYRESMDWIMATPESVPTFA